MRDPTRIKPMLEELEALWIQFPDLRFGQLVYSLVHKHGNRDMFEIEDHEWIKWVKEGFDIVAYHL